jgi:hypothetical protein
MASSGGDWKTNPLTQIRWGLNYIREKGVFSNPIEALQYHNAHNSYHRGGLVPMATGGIVRFDTPAMIHAGEAIIPENVTKALSKAAGGSGGGVEVNLIVEGHMFADERSMSKLHTMLERAGRQINVNRGTNNVKLDMRA